MLTILVTGSAGFIGSEVCIKLLNNGNTVVGVDNHNDYYDVNLKKNRLKRFINNPNYHHHICDISDLNELSALFSNFKPDIVINLAAQAGVRNSIENPHDYIKSNIVGFMNILDLSQKFKIKHLVYASSSSVYGANKVIPFSTSHNVDHPLSMYAVTKKSNELMAHSFSAIHNLPTSGLRFFTVYGPWGRPDMALFKFTDSIINNKKIDVYNYGKHKRDFTYIDDIVDGILNVMNKVPSSDPSWSAENPNPGSSFVPWRVYNIGNNNPVNLMDFIKYIEEFTNKKAKINFLPLQPGDVENTYADVSSLIQETNYAPSTSVKDGIAQFVKWYKKYYEL